MLGLSLVFRRQLGLYGHVVSSGVGFAGLFLVGFWLFAAIFARKIELFDPLGQIAEMQFASARRDRSPFRPALPVRRRQAGARPVRPGDRRRPDRAHHRAARDAARALRGRHARAAGRLFRRPRRRRAVLPGQSGAGLPDHRSLLPPGVAGHSRDADPLCAGRRLLRLSDRASRHAVHRRLSREARGAGAAARRPPCSRASGCSRPSSSTPTRSS